MALRTDQRVHTGQRLSPLFVPQMHHAVVKQCSG